MEAVRNRAVWVLVLGLSVACAVEGPEDVVGFGGETDEALFAAPDCAGADVCTAPSQARPQCFGAQREASLESSVVQWFDVPRAGAYDFVRLGLRRGFGGATGRLRVEIREPSGDASTLAAAPVVATAEVEPTLLTSTASTWHTLRFSPAATLGTANRALPRYALVILVPTGRLSVGVACAESSSAYPGGWEETRVSRRRPDLTWSTPTFRRNARDVAFALGLGGSGVGACSLVAGATCDDGNTTSGDGCSATCRIEAGFSCAGLPTACVDVDECATLGTCGANEACTNTPGGHTCTACTAGHPLNPDGRSCFSCSAPTDCAGVDTACRVRSCVSGVCGFTNTASGTVVGDPASGDCRHDTCDGAGLVVSTAFDADVPDDGLQCTTDTCVSGTATYTNRPAGTACSQGGTACNAGVCGPPVAQTIDFPAPSATFVGATSTLSATASSGLTVTFSSSTTAVCTVSGTTLTAVSAGACTITASQAGGSGFAAATPVVRTFQVGQPGLAVTCTGATRSSDGAFDVCVFNGSGTFSVLSADPGATVEYLVIAGGGGGGAIHGGGGGGAGGYLTGTGHAVSSGTYTVTVGNGGAGGVYNASPATNGTNSSFDGIVAIGGGAGGLTAVNNADCGTWGTATGNDGGSGGGTAYIAGICYSTGGHGTAGQGFDGGTYAGGGAGPDSHGAGGGGAGGPGGNFTTSPGAGGPGRTSSITGTAVTRAGGGGGGADISGAGASGGSGGGGNGGGSRGAGGTVTNGAANTGSGGGGGAAGVNGGAGGSGVVILRFRVSSASIVAATGGTVTTDGDFKVHTFTASSGFSVTSAGVGATVEYLVIAGGGGGGAIHGGGGGGAGGYLTGTGRAVSIGSYAVTVGTGGAGGVYNGSQAFNGTNSSFDGIVALGGGAGGLTAVNNADCGTWGTATGNDGGSGGGSAYIAGVCYSTGGHGTAGQGFDGGTYAGGGAGPDSHGAGGGGAGGPGGNFTTSPGAGGPGRTSSITGTAVTRAGGGGGGADISGAGASGGSGGGGNGGGSRGAGGTVTNGAANTGSGGGGGAAGVNGGAGGSGVVIIRYRWR